MEGKEEIKIENLNRHGRRRYAKLFGVKLKGIQDSSEPKFRTYYVLLERQSRAGVVYKYYKKIVDKIKS